MDESSTIYSRNIFSLVLCNISEVKSAYYFLGLFLVHLKQLNRCLHRKQTKINLFLWITLLIHFFPVFPFDLSWKHEKTKGFLIFSVGSNGNIRKKRVKLNGRSLTMLQPFHAEIYPENVDVDLLKN